MKTEEILNLLEVGDLSEDMKELAEKKGLETVKTVIMAYNGQWIRRVKIDNINKMDSLIKKYIKKRQERNPHISARSLARDTGVSRYRVNKYLRQLGQEEEVAE